MTLTGLIRTLTVASQPLECLPYQNQKKISFTNGWEFNITFPQFRDIRDSYNSLKNYTFKQVDRDLFEVDLGDFNITANLKTICAFADLHYQHPEYSITQLENDRYRIKYGQFQLEGTSSMVGVFRELQYGEYKADFKGKVVLDIGGFQGESAIYFSILGAKKTIIYEPIREYCLIIQNNINLNRLSAEIHQAGIGNENTIMVMDVFDPCLGVGQKPKKEIIRIKNIEEIIEQSKADIAKIDCEGAEICLTKVPNQTLIKIPYYMIELHGEAIRKTVAAKFLSAGFKISKINNKGPKLTIVHFRFSRHVKNY